MKKLIIGLIIGFLLGSFVKVGMIFWIIIGAVIMYVAFKNQLIK